MRKHTHITAALLAGALIAPAGAQADTTTAIDAVKAHTTRADKALDRAVALYEAGADARADRSLRQSRGAMTAAARQAARLHREADTAAERAAAAQAQQLVAAEQDENVEKLVAALEAAGGASERKLAAAAHADVRGRDKALSVLTALLDEVPEQARPALARSIAALATDRDEEIEAQAGALAGDEVGAEAKRTVAKGLQANVKGQATAGEKLAELIAGEDVPEQAKAGLRAAYDAVAAEHGSVADVLSRLSSRMPAAVRSRVTAAVTQARENAQGLQRNRPAPPAAGPGDSAPAVAPQGASGGAPEGASPRRPTA